MDNISLSLRQLRHTLGKMEKSLNVIKDGIVWVNPNGRIQWSNEAFDTMVHHSHMQVLGAELEKLMPLSRNGKKIPPREYPLKKCLANESEIGGQYEYSFETKVRTLDISFNYLRVLDSDSSVVVMIHDITDLAEKETQLIHKTRDLEANNAEMTKFFEMIVGRENRMVELKEEINHLKQRLSKGR